MSIGVPIKVLHEAEGHTITCETNTGEVYRGKLIEAEDNMNCQMQSITVTYRDGQVGQLENVYIRGSKIRFLILPDMLKNAPMFKRPGGKGSGTAGRGKSAILRAQGLSYYFFHFSRVIPCFISFQYFSKHLNSNHVPNVIVYKFLSQRLSHCFCEASKVIRQLNCYIFRGLKNSSRLGRLVPPNTFLVYVKEPKTQNNY